MNQSFLQSAQRKDQSNLIQNLFHHGLKDFQKLTAWSPIPGHILPRHLPPGHILTTYHQLYEQNKTIPG